MILAVILYLDVQISVLVCDVCARVNDKGIR